MIHPTESQTQRVASQLQKLTLAGTRLSSSLPHVHTAAQFVCDSLQGWRLYSLSWAACFECSTTTRAKNCVFLHMCVLLTSYPVTLLFFPRCRTLHLPLLNFIQFFSAQLSNPLKGHTALWGVGHQINLVRRCSVFSLLATLVLEPS